MKNYYTLFLTLLAICFLGKDCLAQTPNLIISEIMYNPPETGTDSLEFIEIYNNALTEVNMDGIAFTEGITHSFSNIILAPHEFLILAKDSVAFQNNFGANAYQWNSGTLSNGGETIQLSTSTGVIIDEVEYDDFTPWAMEANGLGASLVLCDFDADNSLPENWNAAFSPTGIFITDVEIIANPLYISNCPTGPIIGFQGTTVSLPEETISLNIPIVLAKGNSNTTMVEINIESTSTATIDEDFTIDFPLPYSVSFQNGIENDTQLILINVLGDTEIEPNETITLRLSNPNNDATVHPMNDIYIITLEDNDAALPDLVISEIMYNPPETGSDSTEFIEIVNNDTLDVNLVDYTFSAGINFTFPEIILEAGEYIVITRDSSAFQNYYGFSAIEWTSGSLTNSGELIELRNPGGNVADAVEYSNTAEWGAAANGLGASLVLCDLNENNNTPTNWNSSISSTGNFIETYEVLADPMEENNCFIPLSPYQPRGIGEMTTIDSDGILDSLNQLCEIQGIVHGVNFNASNDGLQFVLIDQSGDGITVFSNAQNFNYDVTEGDELIVHGTISQFNGLAEIIPDTFWLISNNNILTNPTETTLLNESTENQLIKINNLFIINTAQWNNSNLNGFNVEVSNGVDTFIMRIDQDVEFYNSSVPDFSFNLTGLGNQFDTSLPYLDSYQIMPRYFEDLEMVSSTNEFENDFSIEIFPNPVTDFLNVKSSEEGLKLEVRNVLGQVLFSKSEMLVEEEINLENWNEGIYLFTFSNEKFLFTKKIIKR